jgi:hypothetical protein
MTKPCDFIDYKLFDESYRNPNHKSAAAMLLIVMTGQLLLCLGTYHSHPAGN